MSDVKVVFVVMKLICIVEMCWSLVRVYINKRSFHGVGILKVIEVDICVESVMIEGVWIALTQAAEL